MYDVYKFNYSPWYSGNGPDKTINPGEPALRRIKEKLIAMERLIKYYREQHKILYKPANLVNMASAASLKKKELLKGLDTNIQQLAQEISSMIDMVIVNEPKNKASMDKQVSTVLKRNQELQELYAKIMKKHEELITLDAGYREAKTKTESNFYMYLFYFFIMVFILVSLLYIFKNPQDGNLDMFILGLAIIIFAYYVNDFYQKNKGN